MKEKTLISVIMNVLNEEDSQLRKSIEGYLSQSGVDIQLIVSTIAEDPAQKIAEEYGLDMAIADRPGIYYQLNNATDKIKGEWFCYASANDFTLETKLHDELTKCLTDNKKICYSSFYTTDSNLNIIKENHFRFPYDYSSHLQSNYVYDLALIDVNLLKKYLPFKEEFGNYAYWDLWLRIFEGEGDVFTYNPKPAYLYRQQSSSRHIRKQKDSKMWNGDETQKTRMLASHGVYYQARLK